MRIVVLGDGLLGSEIVRQTGWDYLSRKKDGFDITQDEEFGSYFTSTDNTTKYDVILNCIACTDTYSSSRDVHWDVNFKSVVSLSNFCTAHHIKLVHISTDYVYTNSESEASEDSVPVHGDNWYSYTKLLGDSYVQLNPEHLILRETHKETPFKYSGAWINQIGNFDYVDVVAKVIIDLTKYNAKGLYNVGTELKNMLELAKRTKSDVLPILSQQSKMPTNVSMNITKLNNFYDNIQ
ncbi:RfbD dTDP-4-dehydrorhamnose reductase [uncultured Caudovirales phage]|uniref:RfbD dTDP-4-dehydrorhamnose reductase n=1 Tax=uncultured Caudovirales phage TaxID=2100421 RepID=A0A6J5MC85_9CAUD|nr:RfbD dTDP-4-dehydrorhamnose reductase [uncultured Caudovirales phage]